MTGKRSSSMAAHEARPTPRTPGVAALVASGPRAELRVRLDRREAAAGEVVADRRDEAPWRGPAPRASAVVAMQVMTAGSGASGSGG